jgi:glycosyltransferase involved in cell wall biosynthesis
MSKFKLLVVTPFPPFAPGGDGATTRVYHQLKILSRHVDLYLIIYLRRKFEVNLEQIREFEKYCVRMSCIKESNIPEHTSYFTRICSAILTELRTYPVSFKHAIKYITSRIQEWLKIYDFDGIQIEHSVFGIILKDIEFTGKKAVIFHDVVSDVAKHKLAEYKGLKNKIRYFLKYWDIRKIERNVLKYCDTAVVMSKDDKESVLRLRRGKDVIISPNGVDLDRFYSSDRVDLQRQDILFMGTMDYYPMREAMLYCLQEIYPRLEQELGPNTFRMIFIGPVDETDKRAFECENISFTGRTPNVAKYIAESTICINPIRFGSGTCLKILEYGASQKAVVSTPKGCEGLEMTNEENIIIAERHDFVDKILILIRDHKKRQAIASNALEFVKQKYSWEKTTEPLLRLYLSDNQLSDSI